MAGLSVSRVVNVQVNLSPLAVPYRNFGIPLIMGSSSVIDVTERVRQYTDIDGVADDFADTAPEFLAAELFFEQSPTPDILFIGRWAQTADSGLLHGAILTPAQQLMSNFTAVTAGAFEIEIDGVPYSVTGLDFSSQTNLNGVASTIQAALRTLGATGARVLWQANSERFDIISGSTGSASTLNYGKPPTATGALVFSTNPAANDTFTLNGTAVTYKASGAVAASNQVNIGTTLANTLANTLLFLRSSTDTQLLKFKYGVVGNSLELTAAAVGSAGNSLTVVESSTAITASGSTLSGGTGVDVTTPLGIYAPPGLGQEGATLVQGANAETPLAGAQACANVSSQWYAVIPVCAVGTVFADADRLALSAYIEATAQEKSRIVGYTINDTIALDPTQTNDLASQLSLLKYGRTYLQYSSSTPYAAASLFGRAATVNFDAPNSAITLKFKQEPGVLPESLTETQARALAAKNVNVFVNYDNNTAILQEGVMANGYFFDERHGADWLQNAVQVDLYNIFYQSPTKVPQTNAGMHLLTTTVAATCSRGVSNGFIAEGIWRGPPIGPANAPILNTNDNLTGGYLIYAAPVSTQPQANREARKAVPIVGAVKLAGAIHSADCVITLNR